MPYEEESLTARDENDELIREERATEKDFRESITIRIDNRSVTIPKAVPSTDAQGNVRRDKDRKPIPRRTTIYDAAVQLVEDDKAKEDDPGRWTEETLRERIPVLCHARHLDPIAVCRVCSCVPVVDKKARGGIKVDRKLVPACKQLIEQNLVEVVTRGFEPRSDAAVDADVDRDHAAKTDEERAKLKEASRKLEQDKLRSRKGLRKAGELLVEMLLADAGPPDPKRSDRYRNELHDVARGLGLAEKETAKATRNRFRPADRGAGGRNAVGAAAPMHPASRFLALSLPVVADNRSAHERAEAGEFWWDRQQTTAPYSSASFHVDHDRCIVCDRCTRSCSDVKPFKVLGHTGKGNRTRVSFDLDETMELSNCVKCGECMTACPTGAITINRRVAPNFPGSAPIPRSLDVKGMPEGYLSVDEMLEVAIPYHMRRIERRKEGPKGTETVVSWRVVVDTPVEPDDLDEVLYPFREIPLSYLKWNEGSVRRRRFADGDIICRKDDYGSTAFLIRDGVIGVYPDQPARKGFFGGGGKVAGNPFFKFNAQTGIIVGELASMGNRARTATLAAIGETEVLEINRNLLSMLLRAQGSRKVLDGVYKTRMIATTLRDAEFLKVPLAAGSLSKQEFDDILRTVTSRAEHFRLEPGQTVVQQGAKEGGFYIVAAGFLKADHREQARVRALGALKKSTFFGEIALLNGVWEGRERIQAAGNKHGIPFDKLAALYREHDLVEDYKDTYPGETDAAKRTATVTALDDAEIVKIPSGMFEELIARPAVMAYLFNEARKRLKQSRQRPTLSDDRMGDYLAQGLYQGQKILALDLAKCTRCDECTKACADAHEDGHSRLLREGLRFGNFLVATSCRSCHKPYCMDGCPVDAIHRKADGMQIVIENHCIGCGLCEKQCPYGAIQILPIQGGKHIHGQVVDGERRAARAEVRPDPYANFAQQALNCDLCDTLISKKKKAETFCVAACPHDAAKRVSGPELLEMVAKRSLV